MSTVDVATITDTDGRASRAITVVVLIGIVAAVVAGATIWLLLTNPVTVANAIEGGEISPLVQQLAYALYDALVGLLSYF
jgi:hypothetical protein